MAEGLLSHFAGEKFDVYSAGLEPGIVNPKAIQVMNEIGIDISHHTSKNVDQFLGQQFNYIFTVCDNAKERCPYFPGKAKRIHRGFEDPAKATGSEEETLAVFRKVRDQIKNELHEFIDCNRWKNALPYIGLVVIIATITGMIYGMIFQGNPEWMK